MKKTFGISLILLFHLSSLAQFHEVFQRSQNIASFNYYAWQDMEFATELTGVIKVFATDSYNGHTRPNTLIYYTHDGANTFDSVLFVNKTPLDIEVVSENVMYVSTKHTQYSTLGQPPTNCTVLYRSLNGGNTWDSLFVDSTIMIGSNHKLSFINDSTGVFVLNNGYLVTSNYGDTWTFDTITTINSDWRKFPLSTSNEVISFDYTSYYKKDPFTLVEQKIDFNSGLCSGNILMSSINNQFNRFATLRLCQDGLNISYPHQNYRKVHLVDLNTGIQNHFDFQSKIRGLCLDGNRIRLVVADVFPAFSDDNGQTFYYQELIESAPQGETLIENVEFPSSQVGYLGTFNYDVNKQFRIFKTTNGGGPAIDSISTIYTTLNSLNLQELENVTVYPNPVEDKLYFDSKYSFNSIKIYDFQGREINLDFVNNFVDVSGLAKGTYTLVIISDDKVIRRFFVKN